MVVRSLLSSCLCVLLFGFAACEGPTGPRGPAGPAGEDATLSLATGFLISGNLIENSYWEIGVGTNLQNWIVTVLVRESAEFAWFEPEWDILESTGNFTTVAIYQTGEVVAGYEYRITVAEYPEASTN